MHLSTVTEILQSIRQSEMTPILQRIYQSEGGSEVCDTLMKYIYKGMAQGGPTSAHSAGKNVTPQQTGFTQAGGRSFGGAEGGGQAMSVLLSWHEKVSWCLKIEAVGYRVLTGDCSLLSWLAREVSSGSCLTVGPFERARNINIDITGVPETYTHLRLT